MGLEKNNFKIHYLEIAVINAALCELVKGIKVGRVSFHFGNKEADSGMKQAVINVSEMIRDRLLTLSDKMTAELNIEPIKKSLMKEWAEIETAEANEETDND